MIYLDTSAAMKLVRREDHSAALRSWLDEHDDRLLSSALIEVELPRATRRSSPDRLSRAAEVLATIATLPISGDVLVRAAAYEDPLLTSLDAVHLATAQHIEQLVGRAVTAFVAYDERLVQAARTLDIPAVGPGQPE